VVKTREAEVGREMRKWGGQDKLEESKQRWRMERGVQREGRWGRARGSGRGKGAGEWKREVQREETSASKGKGRSGEREKGAEEEKREG
jgi:hypothetical protein